MGSRPTLFWLNELHNECFWRPNAEAFDRSDYILFYDHSVDLRQTNSCQESKCVLGSLSGCGTFGREVSSGSRDTWFESDLLVKFIYCQLCIEKTTAKNKQ